MTKNKVSSAMFFVLLAGLIWSFGPLVVRNIDNAEIIPWQYSLIRGFVIFLILNVYLFLNEGGKFTIAICYTSSLFIIMVLLHWISSANRTYVMY